MVIFSPQLSVAFAASTAQHNTTPNHRGRPESNLTRGQKSTPASEQNKDRASAGPDQAIWCRVWCMVANATPRTPSINDQADLLSPIICQNRTSSKHWKTQQPPPEQTDKYHPPTNPTNCQWALSDKCSRPLVPLTSLFPFRQDEPKTAAVGLDQMLGEICSPWSGIHIHNREIVGVGVGASHEQVDEKLQASRQPHELDRSSISLSADVKRIIGLDRKHDYLHGSIQ